jgi:hypothetical protein
MAFAFDQHLHVGLAKKFVRRRQFLKERGFVGGGHWGDYATGELVWRRAPRLRNGLLNIEVPGLRRHFRWQGCPLPHWLQRVQIRKQVLDLLVGHDLVEAFHFGASDT